MFPVCGTDGRAKGRSRSQSIGSSWNKGSCTLLIGPSGSGKSTLLALLAGIVAPERGSISILGTDIAALSASARDAFRAEHIGVVFQMFNLLPYGSVIDNVVLPLSFAPERRKRAASGGVLDEARRLLGRLGIDAETAAAKTASELSVGQQQRVAAARALIGTPEIIIADEPTSALDADSRGQFLNLLFAEVRARNSTLLLVSHDRELGPLFDHVLRLDEFASRSLEVHLMIVLRLALQSLRNRGLTAALTILSIALSVMLVLGVETVRAGARQSFADTISGTDLVVGARSGSLQLLLYSVFRIGNATNNLTWASYQEIAHQPEVAWSVPISLGDSHRGFRVLGTTPEYFKRYKYRQTRTLEFAAGKPFSDLFDTVIGADVARQLGYKVGDRVVIAHGLGSVSFVEHDDKPFTVSGILEKTGTPVDKTVHVSLEAIDAIHVDWQSGARDPGAGVNAEQVRTMKLQPSTITAALLGLRSKLETFKLQRAINAYPREALSAILPGAALQELWGLVEVAETALTAISWMVVATALLGMVTSILTTLNERRREMAILRSVGARPMTIIGLLTAEAGLLTMTGVVFGLALLYLGLAAAAPVLDRAYGLRLAIPVPRWNEAGMLVLVVAGGLLAGLIPALRAYRLSLADGMTIKT